ncbi:MAG: division/cell wall cluster transcriptional repressor MraZ [Deltaproteobacteria bacterium]|nr:division/cell wall cluster transcriptional repressor MraZ [Deltaproteobacteria bacterium]
MQKFQGEFYNSVDSKRRVSIPAKFREVLKEGFGGESLVLTRGGESALVAYPPGEWQKILKNVDDMPAGQLKDTTIRGRIAPATECSFDRQGRIQVSLPLSTHANLVKDVVIVGLFNKIEIWSQEKHQEDAMAAEKYLKENAQVLADVGF